jgi:hypothetical protein
VRRQTTRRATGRPALGVRDHRRVTRSRDHREAGAASADASPVLWAVTRRRLRGYRIAREASVTFFSVADARLGRRPGVQPSREQTRPFPCEQHCRSAADGSHKHRGRDSFSPAFPRGADSSCDAALRPMRRGLENRWPSQGGPRVRIPPPPFKPGAGSPSHSREHGATAIEEQPLCAGVDGTLVLVRLGGAGPRHETVASMGKSHPGVGLSVSRALRQRAPGDGGSPPRRPKRQSYPHSCSWGRAVPWPAWAHARFPIRRISRPSWAELLGSFPVEQSRPAWMGGASRC